MEAHPTAAALALTLAIALASGSDTATQEGGVIEGMVVDRLGDRVDDAIVFVSQFGATESTEIRTTQDGQYFQAGLPSGVYTVTATKDELGSETFRVRVRNGRRVEVTFVLEAGRDTPSWLTEAGEREALSQAFEEGLEASRAGQIDAAIDAFRRALDVNSNCVECRYNLAIAYTGIRSFTDAEREFQRIVEFRPDYAAAYYGLSNVYTQQGQLDAARDARNEANRIAVERLAVGRARAEDAVERGIVFFTAGNIRDALRRFETAVELDAAYAPGQFWLGVSLSDLGNGDRAVSALRRALSLEPNGDFSDDARDRLAELER